MYATRVILQFLCKMLENDSGRVSVVFMPFWRPVSIKREFPCEKTPEHGRTNRESEKKFWPWNSHDSDFACYVGEFTEHESKLEFLSYCTFLTTSTPVDIFCAYLNWICHEISNLFSTRQCTQSEEVSEKLQFWLKLHSSWFFFD